MKKGGGSAKESVTSQKSRQVAGDNRWRAVIGECSGDVSGGAEASPQTLPHVPWPIAIMTFKSSCRATVTPSFKLPAAGSRGGTARSGARRGTRSRGGAGRSTSGGSGTGRRTAVATSWLAAASLEVELRQAELGQLEGARLLAATRVATRVAAGSGSGTGRSTGSRSGTGRSTSGGGRTGGSTSGGSRTARGGGTAGWRWGATAVATTIEQAGVGAVDAGETNQRGGNPNVLHRNSPTQSGPERE